MIRAAIVSTQPARSPLRLHSQTSFRCRLESSDAEMSRRLAAGKSSFQRGMVNRHHWGCRRPHKRLSCPSPSQACVQNVGDEESPGSRAPASPYWEPTEAEGKGKAPKSLVWGQGGRGAPSSQHTSQPGTWDKPAGSAAQQNPLLSPPLARCTRQQTPGDLRCQSNEISESVRKFRLCPKRAASPLSRHMPKC